MAAKRYVGKKVVPGADGTSRLHRSTVDTIAGAALTQAQINSQIQSQLGSYASKAYVDQQDALRATVDFVNSEDAKRVRLTEKQTVGGPVTLLSSGKIPTNHIRASDQTYQRSPRQYFGPSSYLTSNASFTSETTVLTVSVADPGYAYRVLCFGVLETIINDTGSPTGSSYTQIVVRVGSTTGTIIAKGSGDWRTGSYYTAICPDASTAQAARTGATTLYIRGVRVGSSTGGVSTFYQGIAAMVIPA